MVNINLVPAEIKNKIAQAKASANVFSISLVIVFLFLVIGGLAQAANSMFLEPNLAAIKSDIGQSTTDLKAFATLENKAIFLNDRAKTALAIEQKRPLWSQIMQNLINTVPQEVQFASVAFDVSKTPNIVLNGYAKSERNVVSFKDKLEASEFFKNVAFKSSSAENKPAAPAPATSTTPTPTPTTTTPETTPETTTTPPAPATVVAQPTEKRVSFSLEFDLEKFFITARGSNE